jgi:hypothetical protein
MAYQYALLDPIDFSQRNQSTDDQATNVQRLQNAAYDDSPRNTFSFFKFYRPIIEQYVAEFARKNPLFPKKQKTDLFWLTMRHAFALLRSYEHKGYGSFRNLLRQLVNYNALNTAGKMVYMEEMSLSDQLSSQDRFEEMAILCRVLQRHPEKIAESKILRNFLFAPERMGDIPEEDFPDEYALIDEFDEEVEHEQEKFANNLAEYGEKEALAPIIGGHTWTELIRKGGKSDLAASFFGHIRENPEWFGLPANMFEDDGGSVSGMADAAQS